MGPLCSSYIFYMQVQIRPWNLSDSDFVMDGSQPLDPRKTIFVGGVPRPLRAGTWLIWMEYLFFFFSFRYEIPQKPLDWIHNIDWHGAQRPEAIKKSSLREKAILYLGFQDVSQMFVMLRIHGVMEGSVFLLEG